MKFIPSTCEILAWKVLGRDVDQKWIDWAVEMLMAGHRTNNLEILAAESPPFDQFELRDVTNRVFVELKLDYSEEWGTIKAYICYLMNYKHADPVDHKTLLKALKDLCIELEYESRLYDFYLLYFANKDLASSEIQWYWPGANRGNIAQMIQSCFNNWRAVHCEQSKNELS